MPIIYYKSGTTNNVPQSDLSYWLSQPGWSLTPPAATPAPAPAPSPAPSGSSGTPSPSVVTSTLAVNNLYQKYFGRPASSAELSYWQSQPATSLENQLSSDYKASAGIPYDGSPINSGSSKTVNQLGGIQNLVNSGRKFSETDAKNYAASVGKPDSWASYVGLTGAEALSVSSIDPNTPKPETGASNASGSAGSGATGEQPPPDVVDTSTANTVLHFMSPQEIEKLIPGATPGTPEYQAKFDAISTQMYDILQQQATANNEQEKTVADTNWQNLKASAEKTLNMNLSNDAITAWGQVQGIKDQFASRGIAGSGLQNESIDSYLKGIRNQDQAYRNTAQTAEETNKMSYYRTSASSAEIKELVATNPELAKKWGLVPSEEMKNAFSYASMKAKYPDMSDEDIKRKIAETLDENGNYRSTLYQKYLYGKYAGVDTATVDTANTIYKSVLSQDPVTGAITTKQIPIYKPVNPGDTGIEDIKQAADTFKRTKIATDYIASTSTPVDNPPGIDTSGKPYQAGYTGSNPANSGLTTTGQAASTGGTSAGSGTAAAAAAAGNISTSLKDNLPTGWTLGVGNVPVPPSTVTSPTLPKTGTSATPDTSIVSITSKYGDKMQVMKSDYENNWKSQGWTM